MSGKRQNNHYHYAEKFESKAYRRSRRARVIHTPRKSFFIALMALFVLGLVSTTFSYTFSDEAAASNPGSLIVSVRTAKVKADQSAGALASSGSAVAEGMTSTGSNINLASTGTSRGTDTFYLTGSGATGIQWDTFYSFTKSPTGYYSYYYCDNDTSFKISTSDDYDHCIYSFAYDFWGASNICTTADKFNQGSGTNANGTNNFWIKGGNYIVVWYAYTELRYDSAPLITAFSSIDDLTAPTYYLHMSFAANDADWRDIAFSTSSTDPISESTSFSTSYTLEGNSWYDFEIEKKFPAYPNYNKSGSTQNPIYYKNTGKTVYNNCTNWSFTTGASSRGGIDTVAAGSYTFTISATAWYDKTVTLSVTYPSYSISIVTSPSGSAAGAHTATKLSVYPGDYTELTHASPATGYEFVNWTLTSGAATTGSYGGTDFSPDSSNPITVYPGGTAASLVFQANYKLIEYDITYDPGAYGTVHTDIKQYGIDYTIKAYNHTDTGFTRDGYIQVGWSTTDGGAANASYDPGSTYSGNADLTLYPVWLAQYDITYAPGTNGTGSQFVQKKNHGQAYTIASYSFTRTGYTQTGWATTQDSATVDYYSGGSYTANAALTLYPVWSVSNPTISSFSDQSFYMDTVASKSFTLDSTSTHAAGLTVSESFSIESYPTDASASTSTIAGNVFTTSVPGTYTIRLTATVTNSDTFNGSASNTKVASITVYPGAPTLTLTINNFAAGAGTSSADPYIVTMGSSYYFEASVDGATLSSAENSLYTYTWYVGSVGAGNLVSTLYSSTYDANSNGSYIKFGGGTATEPMSENAQITLVCVASCNRKENNNNVSMYYILKNLIDNFLLNPFQKIFNVSSSVQVNATYDSRFTSGSAAGYTTTVYFSNDAENYYYNSGSQVTNTFMTTFTDVLNTYLFPGGVKYLYMKIENSPVVSSSSIVHTTVGTKETTANRPFYFVNNSGQNLSAYRVMAYWFDSATGTYGYQTAQPITAGVRYRVNIPSTATSIAFAAAVKTKYGTPTVSDGNLVYSHTMFQANTNRVAITPSVNTLTVANGAYTTGEDSYIVFNAQSSTFVPEPDPEP